MTVISMWEENHGFLGIAKDYLSALDFLIEDHWLDENTQLPIKSGWPTVKEYLGENWKETLETWSMCEFNDLFDMWLALYDEVIYEKS